MGDYAARRSRVADHAARPCGKSRGTPRPYWLKHRGYSRWVITRHAASVLAQTPWLFTVGDHAARRVRTLWRSPRRGHVANHAARRVRTLWRSPRRGRVADHAARRVRTLWRSPRRGRVAEHAARPRPYTVAAVRCGGSDSNTTFQWCKNREKKGLLGKKF